MSNFMNLVSKRIPIIDTLCNYNKGYARRDLIAGLTVAIVAVPQTMAYAIIAGLPPVLGLYTAIVSVIIASIFGSSNFLIAGTTNAIALLISSNMKEFSGRENFLEMIFLMTFIVGILQMLFAFLRLGKIINYVSHSVIVGFTAGAGVLIAFGQLGPILGISVNKALHSPQEKVFFVLEHLDKTHLYTIGVGLLTIIIISALKKMNKNIPGSLLAIIAAGGMVVFFGLDQLGVKLTGKIPTNLPPFTMINFDPAMVSEVFGTAFIIAIIGLVEAISISKAMAAKTEQKLDTNQEFFAQGISNSVSSFFQCYAGTGSFCRSGVNFVSGAATRLSGILSGVFVASILLFFGKYAMYIPTSGLAGVIMVIAYGMVDKKEIRKIWKYGKSDRIALMITFLATVILPEVSWAVGVGVLATIVLHLKNTESIPVKILTYEGNEEDGFTVVEKTPEELKENVNLLTIQIEGNLYFGSAPDLEAKLELLEQRANIYILRLKQVVDIDITALEVIKQFIKRVKKNGQEVMVCGINQDLIEIFEKSNMLNVVGEEWVFPAEEKLFASYKKAILKGNELMFSVLDKNINNDNDIGCNCTR